MTSPEQAPNTKLSAAERDRLTMESNTRQQIARQYNKFSNANERVDSIFQTLGTVIERLENKDEFVASLNALRQIEDKEAFCQQAFELLKQILDWREQHLVEFEEIRRKDFNANGNLIEINKMLSYNREGDDVHIHVPPNVSTPNSEKMRLIREGLNFLAQMAQADATIKMIVGDSWIVAAHPDLLAKMHFHVEDSPDSIAKPAVSEPELRPTALATISREDLIKYYS